MLKRTRSIVLLLALAACSHEPTSVTSPGTEPSAALALSVAPGVQTTCPTCVFGPQVYTRNAQKPGSQTSRFAAERSAGYIVDIDDGGSTGADGTVSLNGTILLAARSSTDRGPRHVRRPMCLNALNELVVKLTGNPGSLLTISAIGLSSSPLAVWGTDPFTQEARPTGDFVSIADGGTLQTLALRTDGTLYLSGSPTDFVAPVPASLEGVRFVAIGLGRNHAMAINSNGAISSWGLASAMSGAPTTGQFVAVAGGSLHSVALDVSGRIVMWGGRDLGSDFAAVVGIGAPVGIRFAAISARRNYTLALAENGQVYGWGVDIGVFNSSTDSWTPDGSGHFVAPFETGNPYVAVSAGVDHITALRADGTVVIWKGASDISDPPSGIVFRKIAAGFGYDAGIDVTGQIHAWTDPTQSAFALAPTGSYTSISAASGHVTAIAGSTVCPP